MLAEVVASFAVAMVLFGNTASGKDIIKSDKKQDKKIVKTDEVSVKQAAINKTEVKLDKKSANKKTNKFNQTLDVSFSTDTKETSDGQKGYDTTLWYFLTYKINSEYSARLWVDIAKDLATSYEDKLNDTRITLSKKGWEIGGGVKFSPSASIVLPTSEASKRNEELNAGVEINPSFGYKMLDGKLSLSYLPRFVKNFHEYTTSRTNKTNTEYKSVQFYSAKYAVTDKLTTGATLIYSNTWSYEGTRRSPSYLSILEVGYELSESFSVATGIMQGGSIVDRENGPDGEIELYDENTTTFYGNFALSF